MKSLLSLFTEHPASVGETYGQHLVSATGFSLRMIGAGFACLIHALLPFLFVRVGSNAIGKLHDRMILNRARRPLASPPASAPSTYRTNSKALPTS
ncbi:MAG: hypothetical protein E4H19_09130 [Chromatiales bacterium]|nr:MAG: hypothetical protein E4H19_09130 [Chromatiales bacterium]